MTPEEEDAARKSAEANALQADSAEAAAKQIRELQLAVLALIGGVGQTGASMKGLSGASAGIAGSFGIGKGKADELFKALGQLTEAEKQLAKAKEEEARVISLHKQALNQLGASVGAFSSSLLQAGGGLSKYNSAVSSAGDAALSFGKTLGPAGLAVGLFLKGLSMVTTAVLKQNDAMMAGKDALAGIGAAGELTAVDIRNMGAAAGYTREELKKWTNITKSLGTDIIGLSSTVSGGVAEFGKLSKVTNEQYENYRMMGVSQEELTQNQADYVKLQSASGKIITEQMKRDGSLKAASLEYTTNLLQLSAITGLSVEQSKKAQEQATGNFDIQIKTRQQELEIADLKKSGSALDLERADQIRKEITAREKLLAAAAATGDAEILSAAQSRLATGAWSETSKKLLLTIPGFDDLAEATKKGTDVSAEFTDQLVKGVNANVKNLGTAGMFDKATASLFGMSKELMTYTGNRTDKDAIAAKAESDAKIAAAAAGKGPKDNVAGVVALEETAGRTARKALDDTVLALNPFAQSTTLAATASAALAVAATAAAAALGVMAFGKIGGSLGGIASKAAGLGSKALGVGSAAAGVSAAAAGAIPAATHAVAEAAPKALTSFGTVGAEAAARRAASVVATTAGEAATKVAGEAALKTGAATAGKGLMKALPLLGSLLSAYAAYDKITKGDYIGAALEGGAAVAALVPGPGTAIALALTGASGARDIYNALNPDLKKVPDKMPAETSTTVTSPATPPIPAAKPIQSAVAASLSGAGAGRGSVNPPAAGGGAGRGSVNPASVVPEKEAEAEVILPVATKPRMKQAGPSLEEVQAMEKKAQYTGEDEIVRRRMNLPAQSAAKMSRSLGGQYLGRVAAQFESGGKAGMVSSGHGDFGGKSYGAFQLSSKTGDVEKFLKSSGYDEQFSGLSVGSPEFDAKWKELGKDPAFLQAQSGHAKKTHYDPQVAMLKKSGIDLSERSDSVQEAIMSTANQYGAATNVITKALAGKDITSMSDKELINSIQDYKAASVESRFKSSSESVRSGVSKRIEQERIALLDADKMPKARNGGVFSGPDTGFPVELHGNEVVTPFDPSSLLAKLMLAPASESIAKLTPSTTPVNSAADAIQNMSMFSDMIDMLSDKLDTMISKLETGNDTQDKLLKYSRA